MMGFMSIWNKILVGLVVFASLGFFYTAARALKTLEYWETSAHNFEKKLAEVGGKIEADKTAIDQARMDIHRLLVNRGRIWQKCVPDRADGATGSVSVNIDSSAPHRISDKMLLYVFEDGEGAKQGAYIGEFLVTQVADTKVQLTPAAKLSAAELTRLTGSKGPWSLYELMPVDRYDAFAGLSEDELKAMLPAESVAEYAKEVERQKLLADKTADKTKLGEARKLRDYKTLFRSCQTARTLFADTMAALMRDLEYLQGAVSSAQNQVKLAEQEVAKLEVADKAANKEKDKVVEHRTVLEAKLKGVQQFVTQKIKENLVFAAEIAKIQLNAAERIDERTHTMAQAGAGAD